MILRINFKIRFHEHYFEIDQQTEEEVIAAMFRDLPLWARLEEGNYDPEELEEINPRYLHKVEALSALYTQRKEKHTHGEK